MLYTDDNTGKMRNKNIRKLYREKIASLSQDNRSVLKFLLRDAADSVRIIGSSQKRALLNDYRAAVLYYLEEGYSIDFIREQLDVRKLGAFYSSRADRWFPLDYAARVHSLTISKNWMSVFRLSFCLKDDIVPELLQMALTYTIKRFPLFATTIKRGFFWNYIDSSQQRYAVEPETMNPCSPIKVSRSDTPSMRVIYYRKRISIECFHILTDGLGALLFLKTLVVEYLRLFGKNIPQDETFFNINDTPDESEWENGYEKAERILQENRMETDRPLPPELPSMEPALSIPGKLSRIKPYRILHFEMKSSELKQLAGEKNVKITSLFLGFIAAACMKAAAEKNGTVKIQVPVNMRPYYDSKTIANFTQYCIIKLKNRAEIDFDNMLKEIEDQLKTGTSPDALNDSMLRSSRLVNVN